MKQGPKLQCMNSVFPQSKTHFEDGNAWVKGDTAAKHQTGTAINRQNQGLGIKLKFPI